MVRFLFLFFVKILFLFKKEKNLKSPLIFILFFKGKTKKERKTLSATPKKKRQFVKTECA